MAFIRNKWMKIVLIIIGYAAVTALLVAIVYYVQINQGIALKEHSAIGYFTVFMISAIGSATILVPIPVTPLIVTAAATFNPTIVAIIACTGVAVGEMTSYWAGYFGRTMIKPEHLKGYGTARNWMDRYGVWTVFGLALIPLIPFDITGIAAGGLKLPLWKFVIACWAGKLPRLLIEAYAGMELIRLLFPTFFS